MKKIKISLIFLFVTAHSFAQLGTIKGTVRTRDGKTMPFVNISVKGSSTGSISSENGTYLLNNVTAGHQTIVASFVGFATEKKEIALNENEVITVDFLLTELASELGEVVVTGTLKEISKSESPVAIDIIAPKLFQKNPTPSIFESLNMVNGVRPQIQCNVCSTGDIHINGMEGPYTMVMIDGMPIVSALGSVYGLMGIPNSIIERVEVQKGPASTLYGSEAVGGLINVITKNIFNAPLVSFDFNSTTYQEFNTDFSVKYNFSKNLTGLFSGNYFHFDKKWDTNEDNFTDITLQKRIAGFNKFTYTHPSGNSSHLAMRYYHENRWGGQMQWNKSFRGSDSVYGENIITNRYELIGNSPLGLLGKGAKLQYCYNAHLQNSAYGTTPFIADQHIAFGQLTKNITSASNDILLGLALRYTFYDDNTIITQTHDSNSISNLPTTTYLPGIFVQDLIKLNPKNSLLVGLRNDFNSNHGNILSPRANWKWDISNTNIVRLGVGNGYRVVNLFSEDHAAFSGAREVVIKNNLEPEQSWNTNLNYSSFIPLKRGFINLETNIFYTYFKNKIVADYFTDANKVIFDNLTGYGITRGLGAMAHCSFTFPLTLILGATYTDVYIMKPDSGNILVKTEQVQTPPLTGNFVLGYNFTKWRIGVDLTGNVYSPMLLPVLPNDYRSAHSPWFCIMNIQFTKKIKGLWQLYGGVKNLFNFFPQEDPIMRPFDPFDKGIEDEVNNPYGYTFDPGYNYAPFQKIRAFIGLRMSL